MYAVTLLTFDVEDATVHQQLNAVHLALLQSLTKIGVGAFIEKERNQVLIFLEYLRHLTGVGTTSTHQHLIRVDHEICQMSKLHISVVQSLTEALQRRSSVFVLENEYSAFGGTLPVDATIFREGKVVAFIEIDGPHHYSRGVLRRKDLLKEMLYRKKHPGAVFARVRHDQVKRFGTKEIGDRVADFVSIADPEPDSGGRTNRIAERDLKRILSGRPPSYSMDGY
jgi:hypothetical protein